MWARWRDRKRQQTATVRRDRTKTLHNRVHRVTFLQQHWATYLEYPRVTLYPIVPVLSVLCDQGFQRAAPSTDLVDGQCQFLLRYVLGVPALSETKRSQAKPSVLAKLNLYAWPQVGPQAKPSCDTLTPPVYETNRHVVIVGIVAWVVWIQFQRILEKKCLTSRITSPYNIFTWKGLALRPAWIRAPPAPMIRPTALLGISR